MFFVPHDRIVVALERGKCEITGIEFYLGEGHSPWSPSIDRKDSAKGYVPDNIQVVCWMYNAAKGAHRHEDVMKMAAALNGQIP